MGVSPRGEFSKMDLNLPLGEVPEAMGGSGIMIKKQD